VPKVTYLRLLVTKMRHALSDERRTRSALHPKACWKSRSEKPPRHPETGRIAAERDIGFKRASTSTNPSVPTLAIRTYAADQQSQTDINAVSGKSTLIITRPSAAVRSPRSSLPHGSARRAATRRLVAGVENAVSRWKGQVAVHLAVWPIPVAEPSSGGLYVSVLPPPGSLRRSAEPLACRALRT